MGTGSKLTNVGANWLKRGRVREMRWPTGLNFAQFLDS